MVPTLRIDRYSSTAGADESSKKKTSAHRYATCCTQQSISFLSTFSCKHTWCVSRGYPISYISRILVPIHDTFVSNTHCELRPIGKVSFPSSCSLLPLCTPKLSYHVSSKLMICPHSSFVPPLEPPERVQNRHS